MVLQNYELNIMQFLFYLLIYIFLYFLFCLFHIYVDILCIFLTFLFPFIIKKNIWYRVFSLHLSFNHKIPGFKCSIFIATHMLLVVYLLHHKLQIRFYLKIYLLFLLQFFLSLPFLHLFLFLLVCLS